MPSLKQPCISLTVFVAASLCLLFNAPSPASAQSGPIASDGSCSVNTQWEQGKSKVWYIELQRQGEDFIRQGIAQENDATIRYGLSAFDWGVAKQGADGSFPGTNDPFHSTALFVESVAYSAMLLNNYHPKTYTYDKTYYSNETKKLVASCHLACGWLTTPAVASDGNAGDAPYTSRYYILAALLAETDVLIKSTTYAAAADTYANNAMALQLSNGVNPEVGGYDVDYQEAGVLNAAHYYSAIAPTEPAMATAIANMMTSAMNWECARISLGGTVDVSGSTRVGVEVGRDGTVKQLDVLELDRALYQTNQITGSQICLVSYNRILLKGYTPTTAVIAADGSCDYNTDWENGNRTKWNIALQKAGVSWLENGISREDDSQVRLGLKVIDWAFAHQAADGTYPGTSTMYFSGAQFLESAARAALDLQAYHPVSYVPDENYYGSEISKIIGGCTLTGNWLILPANASAGMPTIATSTYSEYYLGAALQETGVLANSMPLQTAALGYVNAGLKLRQFGTNPEAGAFNLNDQALGDILACYYYRTNGDPTANAGITKMLYATLDVNATYVSMTGAINWPSPDKYSIIGTFFYGAAITTNRMYLVYYSRIKQYSIQ